LCKVYEVNDELNEWCLSYLNYESRRTILYMCGWWLVGWLLLFYGRSDVLKIGFDSARRASKLPACELPISSMVWTSMVGHRGISGTVL
jgi:hypothetical protein